MATDKVKGPGKRAVVIRQAALPCIVCGEWLESYSTIQMCLPCQRRKYQQERKLEKAAYRRKVFGK